MKKDSKIKRFRWHLLLGFYLVALSSVLYFAHFLIFKDAHHIFIYLLGDIAFVPIEVLLVTIIIHKLLEEREKRAKMEKLNMVIETFFSETGTRLIADFSTIDTDLDKMRKDFIIDNNWTVQDFKRVSSKLENYRYDVNIKNIDLSQLRNHLRSKRNFLLRLLQNPVLLEHESFTELLRAVFHLTEELSSRTDIKKLPDTDLMHLNGDIKRAYSLLVQQWLYYMKYLKINFPYLFSLAIRMNPFDRDASTIVR